MARGLRRRSRTRRPLRLARARLLPPRPHRPDEGAGLEGLRQDGARVQRPLLGVLYAIQRLQGHLFLNPDHLKGVPAHLSLNTAASFVTNTNWQFYAGESTMSYLTQMAGLAVQNFVSAGGRHGCPGRCRSRHLAPLAERHRQLLGRPLPVVDLHPAAARVIFAAVLISQGVPQTLQRTRPRRRCRALSRRSRAARSRRRGDQAARHERRRVLQLELRRPVRESERPDQLPRDARDPADPGGPGLHVREDGLRATPRVDGVRGDVRDASRSASPSTSRPSSTARRSCATPA